MKPGGRAWSVLAGGLALLANGAALADSSPPQDLRFPSDGAPPIEAPAVKKAVAPAALIVPSDARVESSELGYDQGIAPAVGRIIEWQGSPCVVIDVSAVGGGPTFSAGSRHVITVRGRRLMVALKFVDPDETIGGGIPVAALAGQQR